MHELANIRNHAIHQMTAFRIVMDSDGNCSYYLRALRRDGNIIETNERVLPYLEKTLDKIKIKLGITETFQ